MTERGLPIADGAPACPFVAFEDDRDERATSPDHRHRCYAEPQPAPRALAHQEAYCLSSAFPVCPTFQDWARREAARSRGDIARSAESLPPAPGSQRNPPRNWSEPPPWFSRAERAERAARGEAVPDWDDDDPGDIGEPSEDELPTRGRGLSGSYADRVAAGPSPAIPGVDEDDEGPDLYDDEPRSSAAAAVPVLRRRERDPGRIAAERRQEGPAPEWERAKPLEAYPTLRSRRLPELSVPPILVGVVALALAMAVIFALPGLLGFGNPQAGASNAPSTPTGTALPSIGPTPVPQATPQIYVVQAGDTMSRIAGRFKIPLGDLIAANAESIPNPDSLQIGDRVIIPAPLPSELPGATGIPAAS